MSSSDSWTHVGKDGKPMRHSEFPSDAAAAFGSRGSSGGFRSRGYGGGGDYDRSGRSDYDRGSRWESDRRPQFSDSAAAAFGSGSGHRDQVPRSGGGHAGPYVPRQYRSAVAEPVKPAVAPLPYEEAFPALGGGKAPAKPAAAPTAAVVTTAAVGTAPAKMTFASLVKKTAEEEAAAEELRRYRALKEAEDRKAHERERRLISAIHSRRTYGYTPSNYDDAEDTSYGDDLDHDVYGARKTCYGEVPDVRTEDHLSDDGHDYHSSHSDDY